MATAQAHTQAALSHLVVPHLHQQARQAKSLRVESSHDHEDIVRAPEAAGQGSRLELDLPAPCVDPLIVAPRWPRALDFREVSLALADLRPLIPEQRKQPSQSPQLSEEHRSRMHEILVALLRTDPTCQTSLNLPLYCKNKQHNRCEQQALLAQQGVQVGGSDGPVGSVQNTARAKEFAVSQDTVRGSKHVLLEPVHQYTIAGAS